MKKVKLTEKAAKELGGLSLVVHSRAQWLLQRLRNWPAIGGAKPLRGPLAGCYQLHSGDYGVQFRVKGQSVIVDKIEYCEFQE